MPPHGSARESKLRQEIRELDGAFAEPTIPFAARKATTMSCVPILFQSEAYPCVFQVGRVDCVPGLWPLATVDYDDMACLSSFKKDVNECHVARVGSFPAKKLAGAEPCYSRRIA